TVFERGEKMTERRWRGFTRGWMDAWGAEVLLDPGFKFYIFDNSCATYWWPRLKSHKAGDEVVEK
ncbi:hypothetical protein BHM03_00061556, partial [Ensete ventricosum]